MTDCRKIMGDGGQRARFCALGLETGPGGFFVIFF